MILTLIALGCIVLGVWQRKQAQHLGAHGKVVEAIVFKNNIDPGSGSSMAYPVVRFLTIEKQEWITQELSTGYSPEIPEGTKLDVIYDPENPTNVQIYSPMQLKIMPWAFIGIGVVMGILAVLEFAGVVTWSNDNL